VNDMNDAAIAPEMCRTMLFTPANRVDLYGKAGKLKYADGLILDLEDAVPVSAKDAARDMLISYLKEHHRVPADHPMMMAIRINSIKTIFGLKDMAAIIENNILPDAIFLPKVESSDEISIYSSLLGEGEAGRIPFVAAIETAYGMENAHKIAAKSRVKALGFGGADLAADLGANLDFSSTIAYRSRIVQAARYGGKSALDVPFLNFKDEAGLIEETKEVKKLGYTAKIAIHPSQLEPIVRIFLPAPEEIVEAEKIVAIYEKSGGFACEYRGRMLDIPVVRKCQTLLNRVKLFNY